MHTIEPTLDQLTAIEAEETTIERALRLYRENKAKAEARIGRPPDEPTFTKTKIRETQEEREARLFNLRWSPLSVTLVVVEVQCKCCRATFEHPQPQLFITRYSRRTGAIWREAQSLTTIPPYLPRNIERLQGVMTDACTHCFSGSSCADQLELFTAQTEFPEEFPDHMQATEPVPHLKLEDL